MRELKMSEYFWIQKNDSEGNTIALKNRIKVDATTVVAKLHDVTAMKESVLGKNSVYSLSKFLGKTKQINLLFKGVILEKDSTGRNIPFSLLKEFSKNDDYRSYIRQLPDEMIDIMQSANLPQNIFDQKKLSEISVVAINDNDETECFSVGKMISFAKDNPRILIAFAIILLIILFFLFK